MKYVLILIGVTVLTSMLPPQQDKQITITMSLSQWNTTIKGLAKMPFEESADIIQSIQMQAQRQLIDQPVKKDTTKTKKP